ncbi:hypothetical protein BSNK01_26450 [Bacillaceae bacterium]
MKVYMFCCRGFTMKSFCEALLQLPSGQAKKEGLRKWLAEEAGVAAEVRNETNENGFSACSFSPVRQREAGGSWTGLERRVKKLAANENVPFAGPLSTLLEAVQAWRRCLEARVEGGETEAGIDEDDFFFLEGVSFLAACWLASELALSVELRGGLEVERKTLLSPVFAALLQGMPCEIVPQGDQGGGALLSLPGAVFLREWVTVSGEGRRRFTIGKSGFGRCRNQTTALYAAHGDEGVETPAAEELHRHEHVDGDMLILETNLDDATGEWMGFTLEKLFLAGANDAFFTPILMKKGRPAYKLTVLLPRERLPQIEEVIFRETTSLGVRYYPVRCHRLGRRFVTVPTEWGEVKVKIGELRGETVQISPEYEDCRRIALRHDIPLQTVYETAKRRAMQFL